MSIRPIFTGQNRRPPGIVPQIPIRICCAPKDARAWLFDYPAPVWGTISIRCSANKGFDPPGVCARHRVEFRDFNKPCATELHCGVLASEVGNFIRVPGFEENPKQGRLSKSLGTFQDRHCVYFGSWASNSCDRCDQRTPADLAVIRAILGTQILNYPRRQPWPPIPFASIQILCDRMISLSFRDSCNGLAGGVRIHRDPLMLEPLGCPNIVRVRPGTWYPHFIRMVPWWCSEENDPRCEFIEF
jgi:hypothetical protein